MGSDDQQPLSFIALMGSIAMARQQMEQRGELLLSIVKSGGPGDTMDLREATFRLAFDPPVLDVVLAVATGFGPRLPGTGVLTSFGDKGPEADYLKAMAMAEEGLRGKAAVFMPSLVMGAVGNGHLALEGVYPLRSPSWVEVDIEALCKGQLDCSAQSLTCYRSGHQQRYWSLRLRVTKKGLAHGLGLPAGESLQVRRGRLFWYHAVERLPCDVETRPQKAGGPVYHIHTTKAELWALLEPLPEFAGMRKSYFYQQFAANGEHIQLLKTAMGKKFEVHYLNDRNKNR